MPDTSEPEALAAPRSATGEAAATRMGQYSWALFEFARAPYLSLVYIYVFAPYFTNTVIGDPLRGQEIWSLANTVVGVCIAVLAPVLGAISDRTGTRKPWLVGIVAVMVPGCFLLWWAMPGAQGGLPVGAILVIIIVIATCFQCTDMFHSAMLPSLASPARIGGLSGLGLAMNNAGALIALSVMLLAIALPASGVVAWSFLPDKPLFGLDPEQHENSRIAGPAAGIWLLVFVIPMLLYTPDRPHTGTAIRQAAREGLQQLWRTVRRARQFANVGLYLVARTLYTDGKVAIIAYAGIYASGIFAWELGAMLIFALALTPFAIIGGLTGGWLDNRLGSKRAIQVSVGGTVLGLLCAVSVTPDRVFFLPYDAAAATPVWSFPYFSTLPELIYVGAFMLLAATITAAFANSRTMMARIAPVSMMSQFFGLYGVAGTATAFLGHGLVAVFTSTFQSQRVGLGSTVILLAAGLALMCWVREERARDLVD